MNPPIGFQPAASPPPCLWLHTFEFDRSRRLAGAVVVVSAPQVDAVADLVGAPAGDLVIHRDDNETYLRLNRQQSIELRRRLGKMTEATSPFGDNAWDAYTALVPIENAVDSEEYGE